MSNLVYYLFVDGVPKAQPRPRMTARGHVYNPPSADAWKAEVRAAFLGYKRPPITGPVRLQAFFHLPRPKGTGDADAPHAKKPDLDNLLKSTLDAMTEAGVWEDDALVFRIDACKRYAADLKTGAEIIVETGF